MPGKGGVESIMQISFLVLFFFFLFLSDFGLFGVFFFYICTQV